MIFSLLGGCAAEFGAQKVGEALLKGLGRTLNPSDLEQYLAQGIATAKEAEPKLFWAYDKDGPKGFPKFLGKFFRGRALEQLQKPLQGKGKPDTALLVKALIQEAEDNTTFKTLPQGKVAPWMEAFVEAYFEKTNSALQFQLVREDYCEQILRVFDDVKFAGIAVEGQDIDRAERLAEIFVMPDLREEERRNSDVEKLFFKVGEGIKDRLSNQDRQELLIREQQQQALQMKERTSGRMLPASDLFARGNTKYAVLLGAPGSGKTTLMNYFAVVGASAEDTIKKEGEQVAPAVGSMPECLPIIIRIRDLARHPDLSILEFVRDFVKKDLAVTRDLSGFFEHYLETGKALILLDGLDEVADLTQRYKVVDKIEAFLNQCGGCRTIITSRLAEYKRDFFRTDEFPHYELQPFDEEKINTFIEYWYNSRFELANERERRRTSFIKALNGQERVKQLARNPLLLTIIVLIHRYQAELPKERFKLYDKAIETLLTTWDKHKELSNHEVLEYLKLDDLRRLMERTAYWIHCQGDVGDREGGTLIAKEVLITQLTKYICEMKKVERYEAKEEAKRLLELIIRDRAGLLSLQGQDIYAFVHKTFQEYLCAQEVLYLQEDQDPDDDDYKPYVKMHIKEHMHEQHWREVLLLLITQQAPRPAASSLKTILNVPNDYETWVHRNLFFAASVLAEDLDVPDEIIEPMLTKLINLAEDETRFSTRKTRRKAKQALLSLADTRYASLVLDKIDEKTASTDSWKSIDYWIALGRKAEAVKLLEHLSTSSTDSDIRFDSAIALLEIQPCSKIGENTLYELIQDQSSDVYLYDSIGNYTQEIRSFSDAFVNQLLGLVETEIIDHLDLEHFFSVVCFRSERMIDGLIGYTQHESSKKRSYAIKILLDLGIFQKISTLKRRKILEAAATLLKDHDLQVLVTTVYGLGHWYFDEYSEEIIEGINSLLISKHTEVQFTAASALFNLGFQNEGTTDLIITGLEKLHTEAVSSSSIDQIVLYEYFYPDAFYTGTTILDQSETITRRLETALELNNQRIQIDTLRILHNISDPQPSLISKTFSLTQSENKAVSTTALSTWARLHVHRQTKLNLLEECLEHKYPEVRQYAIKCISKRGTISPTEADKLRGLLHDSVSSVQVEAVKAIAQFQISDEETISTLLNFLGDSNSQLVQGASKTLTLLGKGNCTVITSITHWIIANDNMDFVGNGIDVLSELIHS